MKFELQIWNGFTSIKRIVESDSYERAYMQYISNQPPAYICSLTPVLKKETANDSI